MIIGPAASNEVVCARNGQAYVAATPLVVAGETYPKILCTRALAEEAPPGKETATGLLAARTGGRTFHATHSH